VQAQGLGVASLSRDGITSTEDLSTVLFHELLLPFEVTSVLILIAILGAVALARHGDGEPDGNGTPYAKRKSAVKRDPAGNRGRMAAK
jgi:NADH-quinone oxidoreductase subunit J